MKGTDSLRLILATFVAVLLSGCGVGPFPGGRLGGQELSLSALDRSRLDEVMVVLLETRPEMPYSVRVQLFRVGEGLYLDPGPGRRWLAFIDADPRVRLRFPDDPAIYSARAVRESDPAVLGRFDPGVVPLRLEARAD